MGPLAPDEGGGTVAVAQDVFHAYRAGQGGAGHVRQMRTGGEGQQHFVVGGLRLVRFGEAVERVGRDNRLTGERGQGGTLVVDEAQPGDVVVEDAPEDAFAFAFKDAVAHGFSVVHDHAVGAEQHHADDGGEGHGDEQFHEREAVHASSGAEYAVLPSRFRKLRQAVPADADRKQGHRAQDRQRDEHFQQGEAPVHCVPPERETVMSISRRFLAERRNVRFSTRTPGCDSSACSHCTPCFR